MSYARMAASIADHWRIVDQEWRRTPVDSPAWVALRVELDDLVDEYRRVIDEAALDRRLIMGLVAVGLSLTI